MVLPDSLTRMVHRLRERVALRLLRRMHRLTHRLAQKLRTVERSRILVIAPHMDDDVIGPGGTLLLHRAVGSETHVVFCAAGNTPEMDAVRKAEARQAATAMGFSSLAWLDFPDGSLSLHETAMASLLTQHLLEIKPPQIFCPFVSDHHRDHSAVAQGLATAIRSTGWQGEVWCYEVWSPLWPNVSVDISTVQAEKRQMINIYASQTAGLHYTDGILGLNCYRGLKVNVSHAEAFFVADARHFCELADQMNIL